MNEQRRRLLIIGGAVVGLVVLFLVGRRKPAETAAQGAYVAPLPSSVDFGPSELVTTPTFEPFPVEDGLCVYDPQRGEMVCRASGTPTTPTVCSPGYVLAGSGQCVPDPANVTPIDGGVEPIYCFGTGCGPGAPPGESGGPPNVLPFPTAAPSPAMPAAIETPSSPRPPTPPRLPFVPPDPVRDPNLERPRFGGALPV